ncbi:RING-type E3 ubiquitin transferase [Sarracenia purpurea var. burkii]
MRQYEEKMVVLLNQREEEISKAMNRTMELEDFLRRMEIENQTWQRVAKENETMVASLNTQIEQLKENGFFTNGVEDAESCCDLINRGEKEDETGENMGPGVEQENDEQKTIKMVCKSCNCRNSSVIFIPCKHLCSCKPCQASLDSCPVCGMVKKAYVEALF